MTATATAVAALLAATAALITAVALLIPILRSVRQVHVIVNQQRTDAQRYQVALVKALREAGVAVPDDQSVEVAPPQT